MNEFAIGDYVRIVCHDGRVFVGVLQEAFLEEPVPYILLNGCGFPVSDIVAMEPA